MAFLGCESTDSIRQNPVYKSTFYCRTDDSIKGYYTEYFIFFDKQYSNRAETYFITSKYDILDHGHVSAYNVWLYSIEGHVIKLDRDSEYAHITDTAFYKNDTIYYEDRIYSRLKER